MRERPIPFIAPMARAILAGRKTQTRRVIAPLKATVRAEVRADLADLMPQFRSTVALPGKALRATFNPQGAVSVIAEDGRELGVKPGEFDFVCPYASGRTYLDGCWRVDVEADSRLWVREPWRARLDQDDIAPRDLDPRWTHPTWVADYPDMTPSGCAGGVGKLRPGMFLPRKFSRITLEVTEVRVQRLQDLTEDDAKAEGVLEPKPLWGTPGYVAAFSYLWDGLNEKRGFGWMVNPWVWAITFRRLA